MTSLFCFDCCITIKLIGFGFAVAFPIFAPKGLHAKKIIQYSYNLFTTLIQRQLHLTDDIKWYGINVFIDVS